LFPLILDADSGKSILESGRLSADATTAGGKGETIGLIRALTHEDPTAGTPG
jgi:hypothetical protein